MRTFVGPDNTMVPSATGSPMPVACRNGAVAPGSNALPWVHASGVTNAASAVGSIDKTILTGLTGVSPPPDGIAITTTAGSVVHRIANNISAIGVRGYCRASLCL